MVIEQPTSPAQRKSVIKTSTEQQSIEDVMRRKREEYIAMFTDDLRRSQAMEQQ